MACEDPPRTSVVIPAYRAWRSLPGVLDALASEITLDREAILVDSSAELPAEQVARRWPWLRVVSPPTRALPGEARNIGTRAARGQLIAFLDADAVPMSGWLESLEDALTDGVDAVAGAVLNGTPGSRIGTAQYLLEFCEVLPKRRRALQHAPTCNMIVRRTRFEVEGGFPGELLAGEDTVFTYPIAASGRLAFSSDSSVRHLNVTSLGPFLTKQRQLGNAFSEVCDRVEFPHRWVTRGPWILLAGPLRLAALSRCLARYPAEARQALLVSPLLAIGIVAWVIGVTETRLRARSGLAQRLLPSRHNRDQARNCANQVEG